MNAGAVGQRNAAKNLHKSKPLILVLQEVIPKEQYRALIFTVTPPPGKEARLSSHVLAEGGRTHALGTSQLFVVQSE